MDRLRNKIALITGAAKGQGAYEADIFASEGATVILADVDIQACKAIQKKIASTGGKAISLHLDVTSESDWKRCVRDIERTFGGLDVLVNNAGSYSRVPILKSSVKEFEQIIDVNLKGVFLGPKYSIPLMQIFGSGSIVNISSTAGLVGNQGGGAYGASKGGLVQTMRYLATTLAPHVRVNTISPRGILRDQPQIFQDRYIRNTPLARLAKEDDIKGAVAFLASDMSKYVTGIDLFVDGGWTAW